MVSFNKAQTGSRVYRGVGTSPNLGQVSARGAQGYLKRELNKPQNGVRPVGNDGKSDRRSGVAARALRGGPIAGNLGNNVGRPGPGAGRKNLPSKGVKSNLPQKSRSEGTNSSPVGTSLSTTPTAPQVKVNANGMLELPYSQNMSLSAMKALQGSNEELLALQQEEQALQQEAMQGRRDADLTYRQLQQQNLAGNASSGTAYSSAYGKDVADSASAYSNTLADISRRESDFTQQASLRRAMIQSALAEQLAAAAQENQVELTDQAGELGFGQYQGETHGHDDPVRSGSGSGSSSGGRGRSSGGRGKSNNPPPKKEEDKPRGSGVAPVRSNDNDDDKGKGKGKGRGKK